MGLNPGPAALQPRVLGQTLSCCAVVVTQLVLTEVSVLLIPVVINVLCGIPGFLGLLLVPSVFPFTAYFLP